MNLKLQQIDMKHQREIKYRKYVQKIKFKYKNQFKLLKKAHDAKLEEVEIKRKVDQRRYEHETNILYEKLFDTNKDVSTYPSF